MIKLLAAVTISSPFPSGEIVQRQDPRPHPTEGKLCESVLSVMALFRMKPLNLVVRIALTVMGS